MTPPSQASELYAVGEQWCSERGVPLSCLFVRVTYRFIRNGIAGWEHWHLCNGDWGSYDEIEISSPRPCPIVPYAGFGLYFDSADDALFYGIKGGRLLGQCGDGVKFTVRMYV